MSKPIKGFSKLSKADKQAWLVENHLSDPEAALALMDSYMHTDPEVQQRHDEFIENTIANFYVPLGVAPNFKINDQLFTIPMAIEESSVVAAAAKAAGYWSERGGFQAEVVSTTKISHVHFDFDGPFEALEALFERIHDEFYAATDHITANMRQRGGGILSIRLNDCRDRLEHYYQIQVRFETKDSMGANFINSCLEEMAHVLRSEVAQDEACRHADFNVIMSILSNYTPECIVRSEVSCPVSQMGEGDISGDVFARNFKRAVDIAQVSPFRATTHNKGIMNGIDAVVIATGNDFRAIEAACHAYASRDGQYRSLTSCTIEDGIFRFAIEIPLAVGTVGGLTKLHPLVSLANELLGKPDAATLMTIIASSGLAQNFGALRALTTVGIQRGHMKMHLLNVLNQMGASEAEKDAIQKQFAESTPHHAEVVKALETYRQKN